METIYIKRFIKTEDDLPKQDGSYIVAADNERAEEFFFPDNPYDVKNWLNNIDWYLQPTTLAELIKEKLPSVKEIENEAMTYSSYPAMPDGDPEFEPSRANDFDAGARWIINKLTE